jgi:uncharacterized protein (DUF433 family)
MITLAIEHIVYDPGKCGGKPYIAGKGITVQHIAALHNLGWTVQDFIEEFELTAGQVYAALSYYADHKDEIDQAIRDAAARARGIGTAMEEWRSRIEARKATGQDL